MKPTRLFLFSYVIQTLKNDYWFYTFYYIWIKSDRSVVSHLKVSKLQELGSISLGDKDGSGTRMKLRHLEGNYQQDRVEGTYFPEDRSVPWDKYRHMAGREVKAPQSPGNKNALQRNTWTNIYLGLNEIFIILLSAHIFRKTGTLINGMPDLSSRLFKITTVKPIVWKIETLKMNIKKQDIRKKYTYI